MSVANRFEWLGTGSDSTDLALKLYTGWVNEAPRTSVFLWDDSLPGIKRTTVTSGKSHQFIMHADVPDAEEFLPGEEMLGQIGADTEGTITVDKYLVAHSFIPEDQMRISHYEVLSDKAKQHKFAIERMYDKRLFTLAALGARGAAVTKNGLTVHNGGNRIPRTAATVAAAYPVSSTGGANLLADFREVAYQMDLDNIDGALRRAWMPPLMRQVIQYAGAEVYSEDFVDPATNRVQKRMIRELAGIKIMDFPNFTSASGPFPNQNIVDANSKYSGNFTVQASVGTPVALFLAGSNDGAAGLGVVTYDALKSRVVYQPERLGWLAYSYILCGAGRLHDWCLGSIEVQSS